MTASGFIIGAFARQAGEPDVGKFVLALRRKPGGPWLIAADIDNSIRQVQIIARWRFELR